MVEHIIPGSSIGKCLMMVVFLSALLMMSPVLAQGLVTSWEFNTNGNSEGWHSMHSLSQPVVASGVMTMDVTGEDPYCAGPSSVTMDADAQHYISIRMAVTAGTSAEFFWGTQAEPYAKAGREVAFQVVPDGQFHDYLIDMSINSQWTGIVNNLRLDPTSAASGKVQIDYIRVISTSPPNIEASVPSAAGRFALVGETVNVSATIRNTGYSAASNVQAVLSVDGQVLTPFHF